MLASASEASIRCSTFGSGPLSARLDEVSEILDRMLTERGAPFRLANLSRVEPQAAPQWFAGRFTNVLAASTFVLDLVGRINASLVRERALVGEAALDNSRGDEATRRARRAYYEIALATRSGRSA